MKRTVGAKRSEWFPSIPRGYLPPHNTRMGDRLGAAGQAPTASGIRLVELLAALSLATDLANASPMEKGLRNCLLAF